MEQKETYSVTGTELREIWHKQIDSYNHYQSLAQRFIGILSTGLAIIASVSIGAISVLDINEIFGTTIDFTQITQGTPIRGWTLHLLWLLAPIISITLFTVVSVMIYDSFQIHNSVIKIESPHPSQSTQSVAFQTASSDGKRTDFLDAVHRNSRTLDDMKNKISAGNNQAKRALLILIFSIAIVFYSVMPNGYNLFYLYLLVTSTILVISFNLRTFEKIRETLFPESSYYQVVLILIFGLISFVFCTIAVVLWIFDFIGVF